MNIECIGVRFTHTQRIRVNGMADQVAAKTGPSQTWLAFNNRRDYLVRTCDPKKKYIKKKFNSTPNLLIVFPTPGTSDTTLTP